VKDVEKSSNVESVGEMTSAALVIVEGAPMLQPSEMMQVTRADQDVGVARPVVLRRHRTAMVACRRPPIRALVRPVIVETSRCAVDFEIAKHAASSRIMRSVRTRSRRAGGASATTADRDSIGEKRVGQSRRDERALVRCHG
jgi:hypothetical protein